MARRKYGAINRENRNIRGVRRVPQTRVFSKHKYSRRESIEHARTHGTHAYIHRRQNTRVDTQQPESTDPEVRGNREAPFPTLSLYRGPTRCSRGWNSSVTHRHSQSRLPWPPLWELVRPVCCVAPRSCVSKRANVASGRRGPYDSPRPNSGPFGVTVALCRAILFWKARRVPHRC